MAGPANLPETKSAQGLDLVIPAHREACAHVAKLYGLGYERKQIAKVLARMIYEDKEWPKEIKEKSARNKLRAWEAKTWFRDLVWDNAVVALDMETPSSLRGVARKAKRGRVDAAKLALSVTGRFNEKAADIPAAVTINLVGIPRPERQAVGTGEELGLVIAEEYED
jgi:hypothetical protein